jgi:hypothetical protein
MFEVSFDTQGLVHCEFIPDGHTVNKEVYAEILRRLRDAVRRKNPGKWTRNSWFLLHDNAPGDQVAPTQTQCDGFGASAIFPGLVTLRLVQLASIS